ncbi:AbrB/MazE/SpoVT family DNA-binding domain-containing protein [Candidatus Woesebacteria bacterium]|nr:AbrB/MazE/SpoVT family DNA-binding domain-containing protein [Candidatus Woesebacteria bacterium]
MVSENHSDTERFVVHKHVATISSKRQITIPKHMLDLLGLKPKRKISIELRQAIMILKPAVVSADQLSGSLSKKLSADKK